uniref:Uncharacterized protein n=1 Tax=Bos indicus x Bos taurus TaxID=30522 RepID=A0A4W2C8P1_BOBOX
MIARPMRGSHPPHDYYQHFLGFTSSNCSCRSHTPPHGLPPPPGSPQGTPKTLVGKLLFQEVHSPVTATVLESPEHPRVCPASTTMGKQQPGGQPAYLCMKTTILSPQSSVNTVN